MLTIQKTIYGPKAYLYGATAMVLCSLGAISAIAWGSSWKQQKNNHATTKSDVVVRNTAEGKNTATKKTTVNAPGQSKATETVATPELSTQPPAAQSTQQYSATTAPAPTPKPTPKPDSTPAPTPAPTTDPITPLTPTEIQP